MDIKKFALIDWIQRDLILLKRIKTSDNCSDALTKSTGRQLFYRHYDYIMGRIVPSYVKVKHTSQVSTLMDQDYSSNDKLQYDPYSYSLGIFSSVPSNMEGISHLGRIRGTHPHNNL